MSAESPVAPDPPRRTIIIGSALIAATAAMLQIQLHEYAHGVTAALQGAEVTVSSLMAHHQPTPGVDDALAGPLFSFVFGVVVYALSRPLPDGYLRALLTWMSLAAAQGSFGYLMVGIVMPVGDTAVLFEAWGFPLPALFVAGLIGVSGMFLLSSLLSREIMRSLSDPPAVVAASVWTWLVAAGPPPAPSVEPGFPDGAGGRACHRRGHRPLARDHPGTFG